MCIRDRYYSPQLGQFISRDPLGYVDGMSQYRAYFVPGGMDPSGLAMRPVAYIKIGTGTYPVFKSLFTQKCYYLEVNGKKTKIPTPCPGSGPDDPEGPKYKDGFKQLSKIAKKLKNMCGTCANEDNCTINPDVCTVKKCKEEAKIIQRTLQLAWASNYGNGQGTARDCVAGHYCFDWEYIFTKSLTNQKLSCFKVESGGGTTPERMNPETGEPETCLLYTSPSPRDS